MGTAPFLKFVRTFCPAALSSTKVSHLGSKEVVVDATGLADKFLASARLLSLQRAVFRRQPRTKQGLRCLFLRPLLSLALEIRKGGSEPLFVVDERPLSPSIPSSQMTSALKRRAAAKSEEMKLVARFFGLCGFQVVTCQHNSDRVLAHVSRKHSAVVLSEDTDAIALGAFALALRVRPNKPCVLLTSRQMLSPLRLSLRRLVQLYVLLGFGTAGRLPRVSAATLLTLCRGGAALTDIFEKYKPEESLQQEIEMSHSHLKARQKPVFTLCPKGSLDLSAVKALLKAELRPGRLKASLEKKVACLAQRAGSEQQEAGLQK